MWKSARSAKTRTDRVVKETNSEHTIKDRCERSYGNIGKIIAQRALFRCLSQGWATSGFIRNSGFFFLLSWKKTLSLASSFFFNRGKKWRYDPTLLQTCHSSRFFSTNLEVSRFPNSTCKNPRILFCFEIGKTKRRLTLSHVPCLQIHKAWAKNKFYDRLNWRPWLNPLHTTTQRVR